MKFNNRFAALLRDYINITDRQLSDLDTHVGALTGYVGNHMDNLLRWDKQGSYALGTIIQPVKPRNEFDADILLIVEKDGDDPAPYVDDLYDVLRESERYKDKLELGYRAVTVQYAEQCHVDLVPCVEYEGKYYVCPRGEDELEETDGTALQEWFNERNRLTKGNLKRVVRILKHLRDHKGNFKAPSVILTVLAGEAILDEDEDAECVSAVADTLTTALERIRDRLNKSDTIPVIQNPGNPELTLYTPWEPNQYDYFRKQINAHAKTARRALHETDRRTSLSIWKRLLDDFDDSDGGSGGSLNTGGGGPKSPPSPRGRTATTLSAAGISTQTFRPPRPYALKGTR